MMSRRLSAAAFAVCVLTSTVTGVVAGSVQSLAGQEREVVAHVAQLQEPPDEWVSVSELPPEDRLPAAPLLIGAYAFVLVVLFTYVTLVARRLTGVERDIARLESTIGRDGKG